MPDHDDSPSFSSEETPASGLDIQSPVMGQKGGHAACVVIPEVIIITHK